MSLHMSVTAKNDAYQVLTLTLLRPDRLIAPDDLASLQLPEALEPRLGVILDGRGPIWLYGWLVHALHAVAWVACFDPRLDGAVVIASHNMALSVGTVVPYAPQKRALAPAIAIVGPANSGKSVVAYQLFRALQGVGIEVFLQRAHWDGEGNYTLEAQHWDSDQRQAFRLRNRGQFTETFYPDQATMVQRLRLTQALVLVDVGGLVQPEKKVLLAACSHILVVTHDPAAVSDWRTLSKLPEVAVLWSVREICEEWMETQWGPMLRCGVWERGQQRPVPDTVQMRIQELLSCLPSKSSQ